MPTVIIIKGYRLFFYSNDYDPTNINVEKGAKIAKVNLIPIEFDLMVYVQKMKQIYQSLTFTNKMKSLASNRIQKLIDE